MFSKAIRWDSLFIAAVIIASWLPYVARLGFYSDDWTFLASLTNFGDLSHVGRPEVIDWASYLATRPTQIAYQSALYALFGLIPLGYHIVNGIVLAAASVLLYLVLYRIGLLRPLALAAALLFGLAPHYSTNRFWFAAFGYSLSLAAYLLSLLCDFNAIRSGGSSRWRWKLLSLGALMVAVLGYEIVLPLIVLGFLLAPIYSRRRFGEGLIERLGRRGAVVFSATNASVLVTAVVYKASIPGGIEAPTNYLLHAARLVAGSVAISFGSYGVGLLEALRWSVQKADGWTIFASAVIGLSIASYLYTVLKRGDDLPTASGAFRIGVYGIVVFILGYVTFLVTTRVYFTSTGISNRVAIAAAIGVALVITAAISLAGSVIPRGDVRQVAFSLGIAGLCTVFPLVVGAIASHWADSWTVQQDVLERIRRDIPSVSDETTLILDGLCPYAGPAPVFEANWDLTGALQVVYRNPTVTGDVAGPNLSVDPDGLSTSIYGSIEAAYPYGDKLFVYDLVSGATSPLLTESQARAHFDRRYHDLCPRGIAGVGVNILSLDRAYREFENEHLWP